MDQGIYVSLAKGSCTKKLYIVQKINQRLKSKQAGIIPSWTSYWTVSRQQEIEHRQTRRMVAGKINQYPYHQLTVSYVSRRTRAVFAICGLNRRRPKLVMPADEALAARSTWLSVSSTNDCMKEKHNCLIARSSLMGTVRLTCCTECLMWFFIVVKQWDGTATVPSFSLKETSDNVIPIPNAPHKHTIGPQPVFSQRDRVQSSAISAISFPPSYWPLIWNISATSSKIPAMNTAGSAANTFT
jgi:hypothetical protein